MLNEHARLMGAFAASGEIIGRKKLQKMIFIAKKLSFPFQEKYQFHFFGPYSEELTLRVEELCNMGFIDEVREKKGGYFQYRYNMTENGKEFLSLYEEPLELMEHFFQNMNEKSARFLELVSTVLYFDQLSKEEVSAKIAKVKSKQNYSEDEITEAFEYIDRLQQEVRLGEKQ